MTDLPISFPSSQVKVDSNALVSLEDIYERVIKVSNSFLIMAYSLQFDIDELRAANPSAEQIAKSIRFLISTIKTASFDGYDENNKVLNAIQCCHVMERIANSIVDEHVDDLNRCIVELENLVSAPI